LENNFKHKFSKLAFMKEEILQAALAQFLKYGIREMSIHKLAEPLAISTKTVYKYFKNKEELLEEVLHLYRAKQFEIVVNLPEEQNAACLFLNVWQIAVETEYQVNKLFYEELHHYYPKVERKVAAATGKKFEQHFLSIIYRGVEEGSFRKDLLPEVALRSVFVLLRAAVRTDEFKKFRLSATDLLLNTIANYIRGLCTEKGRQALGEHMRTFQSYTEAVNASYEQVI
jgi:AcrR family transcriptional regulator